MGGGIQDGNRLGFQAVANKFQTVPPPLSALMTDPPCSAYFWHGISGHCRVNFLPFLPPLPLKS